MSTEIIHQITLNKDETLQKVKKSTKQPNYWMIGNGTMNKHRIKSINLIHEMVKCTRPAQLLLDWIISGMVYDPADEAVRFIVKVTGDTSTQKQYIKNGYKELFEKDLVRRVKRGHYMVNPNAIITDYAKQMAVWETLPSSTVTP